MENLKIFLNSPLGKGVVESFRWAVFIAVSVLVEKLLVVFTGYPEQTPFVIILTMALRFIDSFLHKSGIAEKGLTRI